MAENEFKKLNHHIYIVDGHQNIGYPINFFYLQATLNQRNNLKI
jgi:hypothetical protein